MKQIPILSGKAMIVEAAPEWVDFYINPKSPNKLNWVGLDGIDCLMLPPGTWQIVGLLSEVTEEQAADIADVHMLDGIRSYTIYTLHTSKSGSWTDSAIKSLESDIVAEGYTFTNPYGSTAPDAVIEGNGFDYLLWHEAQSRVLSRERCLLLRRVDG